MGRGKRLEYGPAYPAAYGCLLFPYFPFFPWKNGKEKRGTGLAGKLILYGFFAGSGITFILGILNRFGVDPLGMYKGISSSYQILFLSTIGQRPGIPAMSALFLLLGSVFFLRQRAIKYGLLRDSIVFWDL